MGAFFQLESYTPDEIGWIITITAGLICLAGGLYVLTSTKRFIRGCNVFKWLCPGRAEKKDEVKNE